MGDSGSNKSIFLFCNGEAMRGEMAAEMSEISVGDVWKEICELRNQMDRLGQLMAIKADGLNLNCRVCGFQLKA